VKSRSLTTIRKKRGWVRDDRLMGMGGVERSPKAGGWVRDDTLSGMGGIERGRQWQATCCRGHRLGLVTSESRPRFSRMVVRDLLYPCG
jgi:hypothetical protein